jgi:RimJ/RimL family protein N-acetyltransferase
VPPLPTIETERLLLRPYTLDDAADVQRLAGERAIADTTFRIPHPYPDGEAERFISTHAADYERDVAVNLAITLRSAGDLAGGIGLLLAMEHMHAELGYWIAVPLWGCGYATEASRAVIVFAFEQLALNRVFAHHMARNPASGRVLEKAGMRREGTFPRHIRKGGRFEDIVHYGIVRAQYDETHDLHR